MSDYLEIQRRNFEAQFGSLQDLGYDDKTEAKDEDEFLGFLSGSESSESGDSDGSDSEGDSESEGDLEKKEEHQNDMDAIFSKLAKTKKPTESAKVVKLSQSFVPTQASRADRKMARSGRAPTLKELEEKERLRNKVTKKQQQQAAAEDAANLENDLKLQRLLKESHILAHNMEHSGADLTLQTIDYEAPVGNARRRILDQRIREVSAAHSSTNGHPKKLEKMPMNLRKSIMAKREGRAKAYEQEARDAGIVLSKVRKGEYRDVNQGSGATIASDRYGFGKKKTKQRDRGLKIQSVGKSTRHGLRISQHDIDRVNRRR